jgi:PAS domain S-box-containing protein
MLGPSRQLPQVDPVARDAHFETISKELIEAVDRLNCGVTVRDAQGTILFVNDRLLGWLGYEEQELVGQSIEVVIPPELDEILKHELAAIEAGDCRARLTLLQRKDSTTFPVLTLPQRREPGDGDKPYLAVIVDLGTIQSAKPATQGPAGGLRPNLERIALEIQMVGLTAGSASTVPLPLGHPELARLSEREKEVLARLVAGERVPTIARDLHISPHTVRNHLKSMYRQLGASGQAALIERVRKLATTGSSRV